MALTDLYIGCLLVFGLLILIASIDDLIIDVLVACKLKKPRIPLFKPSTRPKRRTKNPKISVCIANWHEADVLKPMVEGNLKNLKYDNFQLVLGVYPNDEETVRVAATLARAHPKHVKVVINRRNGPTSKGQMLNEVFANLFLDEDTAPDLAVIHDSEDMIAPSSFGLYAQLSRDYAMIQIPVFSLDSRNRSLVGASYMEEFAERHSREMLLRSQLGAFVPSAGVGTCIRKDLILHFLKKRSRVLRPDSITEDYILGAEAHADGFKTTFAAFRDPHHSGNPIIATLEYFPKDLWASIRQKTRWVYGISFESTAKLGWHKRPGWNLFFQYRDRKGAITNILPLISLFLLGIGLIGRPDMSHLGTFLTAGLFLVLIANTLNIFVRIIIKALAFRDVYGYFNILGLLTRWPVSLVVNAIAVLRAWNMFLVESRFASREVSWAKTMHEIPLSFDFITEPGRTLSPVPVEAKGRRWQYDSTQAVYSTVATIGVVGLALALVWPEPEQRLAQQPATELVPEIVTASLQSPRQQERPILDSSAEAPQVNRNELIIQKQDQTNRISTPQSLREHLIFNSHRNLEDAVRKQLIRVAAAEDLIVARAAISRQELNFVEPENKRRPAQMAFGHASQKKNTSKQHRKALNRARKSLSSITARDKHILKYYRLVANTATNRRQRIQHVATQAIQKSSSEDKKIKFLADIMQESVITKRQRRHMMMAFLSGTAGDSQHTDITISARSSLFASKSVDDAVLRKMRLSDYSRTDTVDLLRTHKSGSAQARIHAEASIHAGKRSDQLIMARATNSVIARTTSAEAKKDQTSAAPTRTASAEFGDLIVVYARKITRDQIRAAQKHNQQLLSAAMAENVLRDDNKPNSTRVSILVRKAQQRANAWLRRNNLTLSDIGLVKKRRRSCQDLLCVDGILGNKTKTVLIAIGERDSGFLQRKPP